MTNESYGIRSEGPDWFWVTLLWIAVAVLLLLCHDAHAWTKWKDFPSCSSGFKRVFRRVPGPVSIDECSIPRDSDAWNAVMNAIREVQDLTGDTAITGYQTQFTCGTQDGGRSEIAIVDSRSIDGEWAATSIYYNPYPCGAYNYGILESDIRIADDVGWQTPRGYDTRENNGWNILLHEFGHGLNLGHTQVKNFAMMKPDGNLPSIGGAQHTQYMPDDVAGIFFQYGTRLPVDLMITSQKLINDWTGYPLIVEGDQYEFGDADARGYGPVTMCRGQKMFLQFGIGNRGFLPASFRFGDMVGITVQAEEIPHDPDRPTGHVFRGPTMSTPALFFMPFSFRQLWNVPWQIPMDTPIGSTFRITYHVDSPSALEVNRDNQTVESVLKFFVGC